MGRLEGERGRGGEKERGRREAKKTGETRDIKCREKRQN